MAILKVGKNGKSIAAAIRYAAKDATETQNKDLASGVNCSNDKLKAIEDMQQSKNIWCKTGGRQYKSYIQSFAPGEISPEQANHLGKEWAERAFGSRGYEAFIGTHINSKSGVIHNHIIVNSVNYLDGHKIQLSKGTLNRLKNINDDVCREHGLSIINRSPKAAKARNRDQAYSIAKAPKRIHKDKGAKKTKKITKNIIMKVKDTIEKVTNETIQADKINGLIAKEGKDTYIEQFKNSGKTMLERRLEIEGRAE